MAKEVVIRISAQDAASPVFKRLAGEAAATGATIETANVRAGRSMEDFNKKAAAVGASIGAATLILGDFARAAAEEEAGLARLQQAVENTGKSYDDYATKIDDTIKKGLELSFADDQVVDGLAALTTQTGDTQAALDNISLAMDVARTRGMSLSDAATLVGKVHEGNIGILQRYGIAVEEGATAQEALALLQQRTAGQAEAYASTAEGSAMRIKNAFDDATETIGTHTGGLQELLILLPGITAGYTALAGVLAGFGGVGGIAAMLGPLALGAGAAYIVSDALINRGDTGSRTSFTAVNYGLYGTGSVLNAALPGNPFNTQKYLDTLSSNNVEEAASGLFYFNPESDGSISNAELFQKLVTAGILQDIPQGAVIKDEDQFYQDKFVSVQQQAGAVGLSTGQYIESKLKGPGSTFVFDPVSGTYMDLGEYQIYQQARAEAAAAANSGNTPYGPTAPLSTQLGTSRYYGDIGTPPYTGPYQPAAQPNYGSTTGDTAIGGANGSMDSGLRGSPTDRSEPFFPNRSDPQANPQADYLAGPSIKEQLDATTAALNEQYGAYAGLMQGINSANDAQSAFKAVQDGLLESQTQYSGQISEYTSQVNAQDAAYEILNTRRNEGQALNQAELDFLDNYATANERGTGAVEDATIAQGMLAQQYLLNMQQGDALNQTLAGTNEQTGSLVSTIQLLILSMAGVPEEVRTQILLDRADESIADLIAYYNWLSSLPSHVTTVVETQFIVTGNDGGTRARGAQDGITAYSNGGTVYDPLMPRFANGGTWAMVGERGPEMVYLSRGDQVFNTEATRSQTSRQGRGNTYQINGPLTVVANDPRQFGQALREAAVGGSR